METEPLLDSIEKRKILRRLELEAYASVVTAFRAQGPLTENKRSALELLCQHFSISPGRHRAEVRRAASDDLLSSIAESSDWERQWRREGQRHAPSNARFTSRPNTHQSQVLTAATLTTHLTKTRPKPSDTCVRPKEVSEKLLEKRIPSQRVQNVLKYIIAQNPNGTLAKAQQLGTTSMKPSRKVQSAPPTPVKKPTVEKKLAPPPVSSSQLTKELSPLKALVMGKASASQTPAKTKEPESKTSGGRVEGLVCSESLEGSPDKDRPSRSNKKSATETGLISKAPVSEADVPIVAMDTTEPLSMGKVERSGGDKPAEPVNTDTRDKGSDGEHQDLVVENVTGSSVEQTSAVPASQDTKLTTDIASDSLQEKETMPTPASNTPSTLTASAPSSSTFSASSTSTSIVSAPSTSTVSAPSTSTISAPSTSTVSTPSTSTVSAPSTSIISAPSTSTVGTPSTSTVSAPSTSAISAPSTSTINAPSTSTVSAPSTSAISAPSTSTINAPSTSAISAPSTSTINAPSTSTVSAPSTSAISAPSTFTVSAPSTSTVSTPSTSTVSAPSTTTVSAPFTSTVSAPSTSIISALSTSIVSAPSTSTVSAPSTSAISSPSTSTISAPSTFTVSTPSTSVISSPSTSTVSAPFTSIVSAPSTSTISAPSFLTSSAPSTITVETIPPQLSGSRKRPAPTDSPTPVKKQALSPEDTEEGVATQELTTPPLPPEALPTTKPDTPLLPPLTPGLSESTIGDLSLGPETPTVDTDKLFQTLSTESFSREESELASELGVDPALLDLSEFMDIIQSVPNTPTTPFMLDPTPLAPPTSAPPSSVSKQVISAVQTTSMTEFTNPPSPQLSLAVPAPLSSTLDPPVVSLAEEQVAIKTRPSDLAVPSLPELTLAKPTNTEVVSHEAVSTLMSTGAAQHAVDEGAPTKGTGVVQLTPRDLDILREIGLGDEGLVDGVSEDSLLEGIPQDVAATIQAIARIEERDSVPWKQ